MLKEKSLKRMRSFFCRRTHAQNEHGFTFLEAINVHMTRMPSFWKLKMLRDAQIQIAVSKMFQKRQSHSLQTQTVHKSSFQSICLSQKMGEGPEGPRKRKALAPIFWENILIDKNFCVPFAFVKNGTVVFETFYLPQFGFVRLWAFLDCKKMAFVSCERW